MTSTTLSRRALIGAAGTAAALVAVPVAAKAAGHPSAIERHWQDRCHAYRGFIADPDVLDDPDACGPYWDRIDAAEDAILNSPDTSIRATELRLWLGWSHSRPSGSLGDTVALGDVPALLRVRERLDYHEKLIFSAILNLRGEG